MAKLTIEELKELSRPRELTADEMKMLARQMLCLTRYDKTYQRLAVETERIAALKAEGLPDTVLIKRLWNEGFISTDVFTEMLEENRKILKLIRTYFEE